MGRQKHPGGKAGTWIEVKVIKGRPYWYERTRVYLGAGKSRIRSKYLGPGPERTPESAAAELHNGRKPAVRTNPLLMMVQPTTRSPHRPPLAAGKIKALNPKSVDDDGGQTVPITLVTNRQK
jgi:hypothetical protein